MTSFRNYRDTLSLPLGNGSGKMTEMSEKSLDVKVNSSRLAENV